MGQCRGLGIVLLGTSECEPQALRSLYRRRATTVGGRTIDRLGVPLSLSSIGPGHSSDP